MAIKGQAINVTITAIDASTGKRKTGDSANIAVYLVKDGAAAARNDATAISETDATNCPGEYTVELDATDMNANTVVVTGKSATANIEIVPVKIVTEVGKIADISSRIPDALVGGNLKADVIAISGDTTAADNAELMFDGTGYAGGTTKLQTAVASIATDAITAASIKADAVTKIQAGLSTHSANDVKTAIEAVGSYIYSIKDSIDAIKGLGYTNENLVYIQNAIDDILTDTGTTLDGLIKDLPTVSEFEARTRPSADYALDSTVAKDSTVMKAANYTVPDNVNIVVASQRAVSADNKATSIESKLDLVKAKTDTIPANPAQVGSAMTLTSAYDNAKLAWSTLTAQQVWEYGTRTLSSFGTLVADTAAAVWNSLTSALTTVGSIGKLLSQFVFTEAGKVDASADESAIAAAVIAGLGGATVTVISPLIDSGTIQIVPGDTYNPDKSNRLIRFTNTGTWSDLTGATVTIEWTGTGTATCEVAAAGGSTAEQIIDVPLSAANTAAIEEGPFRIYATWTSPADVETLVIGHIVLSGKTI